MQHKLMSSSDNIFIVVLNNELFVFCVPGTSPEGVDIRDYVEVGVTNMAVTTGLTMHDGQTYYVTVRGGWTVTTCRQLWLWVLD